MPVPQLRQRPRRRSHEMTGMLSYHAISVSHDMHAEAGDTTERFSGTRAATTFRNDPTASAGTKAIPAAASPMRDSYRHAAGRALARVADRRAGGRVRVRRARQSDRHRGDERE